MPVVLVVDDDRMVLRLCEKAVQSVGAELVAAGNAREGLAAIRDRCPDVLLLDISLPDGSGLELVSEAQRVDPRLPVAFITVSNDSHTAIEATRRGAFDYLLKPLDKENVGRIVLRGLETRRLMRVPVHMPDFDGHAQDAVENDVLLGRSPAMLEVYKEIGRIAPLNVAVLICGESGTGKELVARAIYQHSARSDQRFSSVNCAALTETLLESELFGHEKGAFTGAERRRIGKFEQCYGGTIFLDEVGDMSPTAQSKILRLLEEQCFERVGGNETVATDVRIISATNRDLKKMIDEGTFRADLYHRLHGYRIDLPPLRERGEDFSLLVGHLLARFRAQLGKEVLGIAPESMERLTRYSWPGNVRELQAVLRTAMLKASGPVLEPELFAEAIGINGAPQQPEEMGLPINLVEFIDARERSGSYALHAEAVAMAERYVILRVLRETQGNQSKAAERLGITRGSLRTKIRALGIRMGHVLQSTG
jgi:DNA-binding NtrC family response regulator